MQSQNEFNSLQLGIAAFKTGNKDQARFYLLKAIREEPNNERAWGWLFNTATTDEEKIHCLEQVVKINPNNPAATKLLEETQKHLQSTQKPASQVPTYSNREVKTNPLSYKSLNRGVIATLWIVVAIIFGGMFGWWYYYGPCGKNSVKSSMEQIASVIQKDEVALQQASSLSLPSLIFYNSPEVTIQQFEQQINNYDYTKGQSTASFQQIEQEMNKIEVPSCMFHAKRTLVSSMDDMIKGSTSGSSFLEGMYLQSSLNEQQSSLKELEAIMACSPFCNYSEQTGLIQK
jgi:hypothetical protein